jgi:protein phosphatase
MANRLAFRSAAASHVGLVRKLNEDRTLAKPEIGLWAVADGMGGHGGGDVAAEAAVSALNTIRNPPSAQVFLRDFERRIAGVNQDLRQMARAREGAIVGTTLVAMLIHDAHFACVWCGDSRAYLLRRGVLTQISRDHSEVQDLIDSGALGVEEAKSWPRRNVVTRALGASDQPDLEIFDGPTASGDRFLLCSDGLVNHVSDAEIARRLTLRSPERACNELIGLTLQRGAKDNVSVVVVDCV